MFLVTTPRGHLDSQALKKSCTIPGTVLKAWQILGKNSRTRKFYRARISPRGGTTHSYHYLLLEAKRINMVLLAVAKTQYKNAQYVHDPKFAEFRKFLIVVELRNRDPTIGEYLVKLDLKIRDLFSMFAGFLYFFSVHVKIWQDRKFCSGQREDKSVTLLWNFEAD